MFGNNIKIAVRNFWKNKTYSLINLVGLVLGMTCFLLIALYVFDELTYDRFHSKANRIYRVIDNKVSPEGKETKVAAIGYKITQEGPSNIPEIKSAARFSVFGRVNVSYPGSPNVFYESWTEANPNFFRLFDFKFLAGDKLTALNTPRSAVVTKSAALKIFGATDVLGRILKIETDTLLFTITGVLEDFPSNSHLAFNLVLSENSDNSERYNNFINSDWSSNNFTSYVELDKNADVAVATEKINRMVAANYRDSSGGKSVLSLQPLPSIHFHSAGIDGTPTERKGNLSYIYVFSIVGLFVLIIACINYVNLTTARFASRGKEIAVRKVAGAGRRSLVIQFLAEALLMTVIALVFALLATKFLLPSFSAFTEKQLDLSLSSDYRIWIGVFATVIIAGFCSGIYPAFFQSKLKPFLLLKNKIQQGKGQLSLRRGLVVFQFSLSIIMIVATIVVFLQMKYVNTADMGFKKEQLLVVDINSRDVRRSANTIKNEYAKLATVKSVSVTSRVPGEWKVMPKIKVRQQGATVAGDGMYFIGADDQFLPTFQVQLLKGRNFGAATPGDSTAVLINETAAAVLGIKEPSEQLIEIPSMDFSGNVEILDEPFKARVVGIVKDFNFRSMREEIAPMVIGYQNNPLHNIDYFTLRVDNENMDQTLEQLKVILQQTDVSHLFEYNFLDKQWDNFYRDDRKRETIFLAIAIMTIFIACLGLFGLATYAAEQRIREIGIRKVLGASIVQLIGMLSKDFIKLVLIAAVVAIPVAWWMMNNWLNDFAYRTKLYWWIFVAAGAAALLIALCTVGLKALKAAVSNPVKSLRSE
jgi:putative ABC transport system permease protein